LRLSADLFNYREIIFMTKKVWHLCLFFYVIFNLCNSSHAKLTPNNFTTDAISGSYSTGDITYIYDDLGRLMAVVDPTGDTAVYHYDAVGNLLSISRYSSSTVSVITFTPGSGAVGATVTIYGTGFSTTPSQNAVTFNGTAATVSAATATQPVTTVPTGATTGTIGVTSPSGSATSSASFTVTTTNLNAPTISSFTPTIGMPGIAVAITGTNFDPDVANNQAAFDVVQVRVNSSTTTSINTNAPQTGSGHLSVTTPNGTAVSTGDFFIPPPGYTVASVLATGRLTYGTGTNLPVITANKLGLYLFDGTMGDESISISPMSRAVTPRYPSIIPTERYWLQRL
jgi:YD repeat-containing protein